MKILLVGEYSRLHNSLKEGLIHLGHSVTIIGDGDLFKNYPVDISIKPKVLHFNWFTRKCKVAFYKLTTIDLALYESAFRFYWYQKKLKNYDVVQFINSNALKTPLFLQKKQLDYLKKHNKKLFLCACGTDTPIMEYLLENKMKYHILTPVLLGEHSKETFKFEYSYVTPTYKKYYAYFENFIDGIIPSDIDYYLALQNNPKTIQLIPNPIHTETLIKNNGNLSSKTHIFLGINSMTELKKGCHYFENALKIIAKKYNDKVEITVTRNLPYSQYIQHYNSAHILLDMVYAYDQGFNALEAMAKGKVVFAGAEQEFLDHYGITENEVCINALPDVDYLVEKLSWLIENPSEITRIGKNASAFVKKEHHYISVAQKYLEVYKKVSG